MVIEQSKVTITNANQPHGFGSLDINTFEPYQKNPSISRVFREIGLTNELGSGMKNSYKYTKLCSGREPSFVEDGNVFRIVIPLSLAATISAGPVIESKINKNRTLVNGILIKQDILERSNIWNRYLQSFRI